MMKLDEATVRELAKRVVHLTSQGALRWEELQVDAQLSMMAGVASIFQALVDLGYRIAPPLAAVEGGAPR